jgi:hypothetical protein
MNGALLHLYRHKTWATLRLIEYCQGLDDEHLDAAIPGTYGTIRDWEVLAQDTDVQSQEITSEDGGWRMLAAVPVAQAIHHADDHRTHVLSILGARGLDDPGLSVWRYAMSAGLMQESQPAASD